MLNNFPRLPLNIISYDINICTKIKKNHPVILHSWRLEAPLVNFCAHPQTFYEFYIYALKNTGFYMDTKANTSHTGVIFF